MLYTNFRTLLGILLSITVMTSCGIEQSDKSSARSVNPDNLEKSPDAEEASLTANSLATLGKLGSKAPTVPDQVTLINKKPCESAWNLRYWKTKKKVYKAKLIIESYKDGRIWGYTRTFNGNRSKVTGTCSHDKRSNVVKLRFIKRLRKDLGRQVFQTVVAKIKPTKKGTYIYSGQSKMVNHNGSKLNYTVTQGVASYHYLNGLLGSSPGGILSGLGGYNGLSGASGYGGGSFTGGYSGQQYQSPVEYDGYSDSIGESAPSSFSPAK